MPVDGSTSTSVARTRFLKAFVKVNRKIFWDDAGNINNDVYLIAISDSAAVPNPGVIGGFVNTYFKDHKNKLTLFMWEKHLFSFIK